MARLTLNYKDLHTLDDGQVERQKTFWLWDAIYLPEFAKKNSWNLWVLLNVFTREVSFEMWKQINKPAS